MCNFCKDLLKCPEGEKRKKTMKEDKTIKASLEMVVDFDPREGKKAFIHADMVDDLGCWHNMPFYISHCPCCGTFLL